ncbi:hypothetical protein A1F96_09053 [Pyrenophora tritici-repentis]|nr:hypothetical protein PtrSN001C_007478 [Pyrenophora tritici-repentis]KAI1599220.1 hypothetical protein PtrCC142_007609 [Pyrenophora tritici-repentis]PWO23043.1 UhpC, Sugar phosphate permease [Pyrenophora tritici-repentis]PZD24777.1 hypothetical protein A1F96_09053 [Pyrenophora tritici-repentis]
MSSLRLATAINVRAFQNLTNALSMSQGQWTGSIEGEALADEIGRFRVWAGNLGALQKGHSSLDYRLRDSPVLSNNALKLLHELEHNLNESHAVVSGVRELKVRFEDMIDIIDNLYKLSVRIRTPSIRSRSLKASSYMQKDPETGVDVLSMYAELDLKHVQELLSDLRRSFPNNEEMDKDFLIVRLSKSITLRRRNFKYWKRHRDKLGAATGDELFQAGVIVTAEEPGNTPYHYKTRGTKSKDWQDFSIRDRGDTAPSISG